MWSDHFSLYGYPDNWWPELVPTTEYKDFTYDATDDIPTGDTIVGLSIVVAPSGSGEVTMSRLGLTSPDLITVWLTGGVPGRTYLYEIVITTAAGRTIPILIGQVCMPVLEQCPIPPPPVPGFGTVLTWSRAPLLMLNLNAPLSIVAAAAVF